MHVSNGGSKRPRKVWGADAKARLMDAAMREAYVRATSGLPGVKPDKVYEIRAGRAFPWRPITRALEQAQDVGADTEAVVYPLALIRAYLEARRAEVRRVRKAA